MMACETFIEKTFRASSRAKINLANVIITEYQAQGFTLNLRQLYYQFVARDLMENTTKQYKQLGSIINDARLAGLIDWDAIEDRGRFVRSSPHWLQPQEIVADSASQFAVDKWERQPYRPEVWIEKDALIGVIERVCRELDVPYFSCRGYNSQSEQYRAGKRFEQYAKNGQDPILFHLGDHDPSGLDMTRDNADRLAMLAKKPVEIRRLALNIDQVKQYKLPPNPAKLTDSRASEYLEDYGRDSWELDALDPTVIAALIKDAVLAVRDEIIWRQDLEREAEARDALAQVAERWTEVVGHIDGAP